LRKLIKSLSHASLIKKSNMFDQLDRIREKPRKERQAIAVSIAALITGVIFTLWVVSFFASLGQSQKEYKEEIGISPESISNFDTFITSFQEARDSIGEEVGEAREQFNVIRDSFEGAQKEIKETKEVPSLEEEIKIETEIEVTPSGIEIIQVEE